MRLNLGYQNLISENYHVPSSTDYGLELIPGTDAYGTTYAPDGSSIAYGVSHDDFDDWRGVTTDLASGGTRTDVDAGEDIFIWHLYVKPTNDGSHRTVLYIRNSSGDSDSFGYNVHFVDGSVVSSIDNPWGSNAPSLAYGYVPIKNNWFYLYVAGDCRNKPANQLEFKYYINAPNADWDTGEGCYIWRPTLEKSQIRYQPGFPKSTGLSVIDQSDFPTVEFSQLPSNIGEIENDLFDVKNSTDGALLRPKTHNDRNLKTMVWDKIHYNKHGKMIYGLREGLRDKLGLDCALFYPENFKSHIKTALIRIVDFRFTYTEIPNIAHVEIDYYITDSIEY